MLCPGCGFDGSCDLERFPTLGIPVNRGISVARRRALRQQRKSTPKTSGTGPSERKTTGETENFAAGVSGATAKHVQAPVGGRASGSAQHSTAAPEIADERAAKRQTRTLRLGWLCLLVQIVIYITTLMTPGVEADLPFLTVVPLVIVITGLMQYSLKKHVAQYGFRPLPQRKKYELLYTICGIFGPMAAFFDFFLLILVMDNTLVSAFKGETGVLFTFLFSGMTAYYHFRWIMWKLCFPSAVEMQKQK